MKFKLNYKEGDSIGELTFVREDGVEKIGCNKVRFIIAKCECGAEFRCRHGNAKSGHTRSCGCLHAKAVKEYGLSIRQENPPSQTRIYKIWTGMKMRCLNPNNSSYHNYGGRGISVCEKWMTFEGFYEDMREGYSDDLTLDRIDVNGNYEPSNCRWADYSTQGFNQKLRSSNRSGKTGVFLDNRSGKWTASITVNYKEKYLGSFTNFEDAVLARELGELKYFGYLKGN